jgi:hypothetical protein
MSQVTNLAFFRARRDIHAAALTFSSYIFLTKCAGFAPGLLPTIGPLLGPEGVAQNIPSGRDDFSNLL